MSARLLSYLTSRWTLGPLLSLSCVLSVGLIWEYDQQLSALPSDLPSDSLVIIEKFETPDALKRFKRGAPDLGFKAGEKGREPWSIRDGELFAQGAHNATLWLQEPLPEGDVRISFTATAHTQEGDVKVELFGDGIHHQSGYVLVNGGWKNSMRIIARQDEHGEDRREDRRCRSGPKCAPRGQKMEWVIERHGGTISWYLDHQLVLHLRDTHPLSGRYLGFGNWSAETSFDDLQVVKLRSKSLK